MTFVVLAASVAQAQTIPVRVVRIVDGDTFHATAPIWPGISISTAVRVDGADTPETYRPGCPEERAKGREATDMLAALLTDADIVTIVDPRYGRWAGRVVARVEADGRDVALDLIEAGLAVPYDGTGERNWCRILGAQP